MALHLETLAELVFESQQFFFCIEVLIIINGLAESNAHVHLCHLLHNFSATHIPRLVFVEVIRTRVLHELSVWNEPILVHIHFAVQVLAHARHVFVALHQIFLWGILVVDFVQLQDMKTTLSKVLRIFTLSHYTSLQVLKKHSYTKGTFIFSTRWHKTLII